MTLFSSDGQWTPFNCCHIGRDELEKVEECWDDVKRAKSRRTHRTGCWGRKSNIT